MNFSFSTLINMTVACCILTGIICLLMRYNRMLAHFGTTLILGITCAVMLRFLFPVEFSFTKSVYIYDVYPPIYHFFADDFIRIGNWGISLNTILVCIWLTVSVILFLRSIRQYAKMHQYCSSCKQVENELLFQVLAQVNTEFGKTKHFTVIEACDVHSPMVFGLFKPYIILPPIEQSREEWYYILKHELNHYYHGHLLYKLICELLCDLYWWNPVVYLFRKVLRNIMEMDADKKSTCTLSDNEILDYLQCLSEIARLQTGKLVRYEWTLTFVSPSRTYLMKRSKFLLEKMEHRKPRFFFPAAVLGMTFLLFFAGSVFVIFEPSARPEDIRYDEFGSPVFGFSEKGCFYVKNEANTFTLYVNWVDYGEWNVIPTNDSNIKIYTTLEEAYQNEKTK